MLESYVLSPYWSRNAEGTRNTSFSSSAATYVKDYEVYRSDVGTVDINNVLHASQQFSRKSYVGLVAEFIDPLQELKPA
jgi:hypothetical protein